LTSFALLLGGGNQDCDGSLDNTIIWISVAFVGAAFLVVLFSVVLIEIRLFIRRRNQIRFIRSLPEK